MAGSFGFERGHYDVSMKVGELVLLPAVRQASKDTLIIADGFSCREQIRQATDREALHMAQVLPLALQQRSVSIPVSYPERLFTAERKRQCAGANRKAALIAGTAITTMAWCGLQNRNMRIRAGHWRNAPKDGNDFIRSRRP